MTNVSYAAVFEKADDGTWGGYVPDLPVILVNGLTLEEAENNMREAIQVYLDEMRASGFPVPPPSVRAINIDVAA